MAVSVKNIAYDKKTLARAIRLRNAALKIRSMVEEWQPGIQVSSVQRGPFRIRYRDPGQEFHAFAARANKRLPSNDPRPPFGLEIIGKKPLLRTEWDDDTIRLTLFKRGGWEAELLRLASRTSRVGR